MSIGVNIKRKDIKMKKRILKWLNEIFYFKATIYSNGVKELEFKVGTSGIIIMILILIFIVGWLL